MRNFSLKTILLKLLITSISVIVTLVVFEITLYYSDYLPYYRFQIKELPLSQGTLMIKLDPELLYRVVPHSHPDINNLGFRDKDFSIKKKSDIKRVVVLGDSFVMGNNVSRIDTIPGQLQLANQQNFEVFNMGLSGYGPDQELLLLKKVALNLNPDLVILGIYAGNDLRDIDLNGIFEIDKNGFLLKKEQNPVELILPTLRTSMLFRMLFQKRYLEQHVEDQLSKALLQDKNELILNLRQSKNVRRLKLMQAIFKEFKEISKINSIPMLIAIFPSYDAFELNKNKPEKKQFVNEQAILELCQQAVLSCIDLTSEFLKQNSLDLYDPNYKHFNAKGNKIAADIILRELSKIDFLGDRFVNS